MRLKPPALSPDVRALCGRLANERTKRTAWTIAAQTRSAMLARLLAGEPVEVLIEELNGAILQAEALNRRAP